MSVVLGIDAGGTSMRFRRVFFNGSLAARDKKTDTPTTRNIPSKNPRDAIAAMINKIVTELDSDTLIPEAIGISFAGPVTKDGTVVVAPNIWGSTERNVALAKMVSEATEKDTWVGNDMTAAAYRERQWGQGQNLESFLLITVSSGVGSKICIDGKVLLGWNGIAGEIGHMVIDPSSNIPCGCGGYGHLESLASGIAAERVAKNLAQQDRTLFNGSNVNEMTGGDISKITTRAIATAAGQEDAFALRILHEVCRPLAIGINHTWATSATERVFIIGGFALGVGDTYLKVLREEVNELGLMGIGTNEIEAFTRTLIVNGTDDDNSGVIGAAAGAFNHFQIAA